MLAVGLYGRPLPGQNGAPLRLVVPWKYGFKGIKSIVKIRFTEKQPPDHLEQAGPRASTASTPTSTPRSITRAGARRRSAASARSGGGATLPFNGYADAVAGLYAGMDLRKNF